MLNDWRLYTDESGIEQKHVAWHEVLKEIAQLNGSSRTLVHAAYGDHVDLVVAGGNNGKVLVQWKEHEPAEQHYVLVTDKPSGVMSSLVIEGSEVTFPVTWCVPLEQVVPLCGDILRTCDKGEPAQLQWLPVQM
ncbi:MULTISPECIES: hypothetical protein [Brevibacillus]|jgi:hypothetical protein|uniref:Uncharacterized protein n=1 Tax=Brevibacillus centrosporus TaxID=54910 RepID=A0A1I3VNZ6_9BACL|nr:MULTISPECIES: hypothetical protein [Brevibacillus]MEC2130806.1 hypothetical protein [Brevibacillus centrosporus]MED1796645.1 hypothetical protein [Brevibacillus nitrificans]MED1953348.1 hypothetical protein [Brevibacillus centrosporus]RNB69167.1 hypothetical protein EDM55_14505 [Brevibacillus centrosporus]SFJ96016.1 hypothetical protein SAMN05518846_10768 [Brevibacillus centrosporus]